MSRDLRPLRGALVAALGAATLAASPLHAQRCLGFPGFATHSLRLDGTLRTGDHRTDLGADLAFGQAAGVFGSVGLGVADYDGTSESALLVDGSIGTQVNVGTPSRGNAGAQLCPFARLEYRDGPDFGDIDQSGLAVSGGLALGTSLAMSPGVRIAPFGTVQLAYERYSADSPRGSSDDAEMGGIFELGAGLIFNDRFTLRPAAVIPVGFEGQDARFGLTFGIGFGRR